MSHEDIRRRGFKDRTRLADAREALAERVTAHGRTITLDLVEAAGHVTASPVSANRDVPHYDRAAMDGWAVRATDTHGASDRSPVRLWASTEVDAGRAVAVNTGEELPAGADAVVMKEQVEAAADALDVFAAVPVGANVGDRGEDIKAGTDLVATGQRLRPSDLGVLKSVGVTDVTVAEPTRVAVIPTGDELVQADPVPGEIIETNGLTVTQLVERWGGNPSYRDIVPDSADNLTDAIENDLDHDIVVTTGGSSVGNRDLVPELVDERGDVYVHGVALKPGHPIGLGVIEETPVLMLPGYPVACMVNAMQFLRPAIAWAMGADPYPIPRTEAPLDGKIRSEAGHRTFSRVTLDTTAGETVARPVRTSGAGILSSVAIADGWVVVAEQREGIPSGETVTVERWEWPP